MKNYIILVILFIANISFAQEVEKNIAVFAKATEQGIIVKWIPEDYNSWLDYKQDGFNILRKKVGGSSFSKINQSAIKVSPLDEIAALGKSKNSQHMGFVHESLFQLEEKDLNFDLNMSEGVEGIQQAKNDIDFAYMIIVLSSIYDLDAAKALGWVYEDVTAVDGANYEYKIEPVKTSGKNKIVSQVVQVNRADKNGFETPKIKHYPGDTKLTFAWQQPEVIVSWFAERKTGKKPYLALSESATVEFSGTTPTGVQTIADSNLVNNQIYDYRIQGIDIWGDTLLVASMSDQPIDLTPPASPFLPQPKHTSEKVVTVSWMIEEPGEKDLKGFIVSRSSNPKGPFSKIHESHLSKKDRQFEDQSFSLDGANYYCVYAIDEAGNYSLSNTSAVALVDSVAPAAPTIATSNIDTNGIVTLTINPAKENDLLGYKLLFANDPDHEFVVLNEYLENESDTVQVTFNDTINLVTLTEKVYYRLVALDEHYNESQASEIIALERPDIVPPARSIIRNYKVDKTGITLFINPSNSRDVVAQNIYKRKKGEMIWEKIGGLTPKIKEYKDDINESDTYFEYYITAEDEEQLESKPSPMVMIKTLPKRNINTPILTGIVNKNDKTITLKIDAKVDLSEYRIAIYRNQNQKGNQLVTYLNPDEFNFQEKLPPSVNTLEYTCKIFGKYESSKPSDAFTVAMP